jgi:hypothetical protein
MGFVKQTVAKATGADVQADAAQRAADEQASATRSAADAAARSSQEQAAQAARSMEANAARATAQAAAADAASKPVENVDVNLGKASGVSASGTARNRRAKFGVGTTGGVSI